MDEDLPEIDPGPPGRAHMLAALVLMLFAMVGLAVLVAAVLRALG